VADGFVPNSSVALTYPATLPRAQLDTVFVTPDISVKSYQVLETDQARLASDHLPVVTDLLLPSL
jgi:endonuclease/exonuclease/phosphatase family metal-dependent hydrolase